jgi:DNA-3-methyladenine glycosylase II
MLSFVQKAGGSGARAMLAARGIGKREYGMGIDAERLKASLDALAERDPAIAAALARIGYPEPRISEPGYHTLLRAIVGQQVSIKAAASMWAKLTAVVGDPPDPERLLAATDEDLRGAGLSRQKMAYARSLADEVVSGRLDFAKLPEDDEEAIAELVRVKGIGRWTAEVYLLFAEGRLEIWPAGDLAARSRPGGSSACPTSRPRSSCAACPRPGARIAALSPSSPGTTARRWERRPTKAKRRSERPKPPRGGPAPRCLLSTLSGRSHLLRDSPLLHRRRATRLP